MSEATRLINAIDEGDPHAARQLLPLVYDELRKLAVQRMAREGPGQTLQATALVHEAYLRLTGNAESVQWNSRGHFFAAAAEAMRRILIDNARHKGSKKAGGDRERMELAEVEMAVPARGIDTQGIDLLALDEALQKLERKDKRKADLVKLRFFAGLSNQDAASALGISSSTADNDWAYARAWLRLEMNGGDGPS